MERLLTVRQFADALTCGVDTARRLIDSGAVDVVDISTRATARDQITTRRHHRAIRVPEREAARLIAERTTPAVHRTPRMGDVRTTTQRDRAADALPLPGANYFN